jgi:polysaccharide export outer membrane protein
MVYMTRLILYLKCSIVSLFLVTALSSCLNTSKVAYFKNVPDSARIASPVALEAVIQKNDILSIAVSSLSNEATVIFNMPNLPVTPNAGTNPSYPQTGGYLVGESGEIKFPVLGSIRAAGLTSAQLEKLITDLLVEKKLLFDPVVSARFLNFRVTVLGEVGRPGVVFSPNEQISLLEAIGQAGDLTIYGLRENVILIRQEENGERLIKRLDLTSSSFLSSPYYFLKSNDVIYVEPGKNKIASTDATLRVLPVVFSGISVIVVVLNTLLK